MTAHATATHRQFLRIFQDRGPVLVGKLKRNQRPGFPAVGPGKRSGKAADVFSSRSR